MCGVTRDRLITALVVVFAGLAVLLGIVSVVYEPFVFVVTLFFAAAAYLMWYHVSGRLGRRIYQRVEEQARVNDGRARRGGFGAGPREEWNPRSEWARRDRFTAGQQRRRRPPSPPLDGPTTAEAYDILDLDPDADEATIRSAYREKVKAVHPDAESGDEEAFKRVTAAYERLT